MTSSTGQIQYTRSNYCYNNTHDLHNLDSPYVEQRDGQIDQTLTKRGEFL